LRKIIDMRHTLSTTFLVVEEVANEWIVWMKFNYIEAIKKSGLAENLYFNQVIGAEQEGGLTFSVLAVFSNKQQEQTFLDTLDFELTNQINKSFPNKVYPFRTNLQEV